MKKSIQRLALGERKRRKGCLYFRKEAAPRRTGEGMERRGEESKVWPTGLADPRAAGASAFSGLVGGSGLRACWEKFCQD